MDLNEIAKEIESGLDGYDDRVSAKQTVAFLREVQRAMVDAAEWCDIGCADEYGKCKHRGCSVATAATLRRLAGERKDA